MLTVREAAELLGIHPQTVRQLIANGTLNASKYGRDWLIREQALTAKRVRERRPGRPKGRKDKRPRKPGRWPVKTPATPATETTLAIVYEPQGSEGRTSDSQPPATPTTLLTQRDEELTAKLDHEPHAIASPRKPATRSQR